MKEHNLTRYPPPHQPSFALHSSYFLKREVTGQPVAQFYQFRTEEKDASPQMSFIKVIPDGVVDLFVNLNQPEVFICGAVTENKQKLLQNNTDYFGVRFKPGFHFPNRHVSPCEMINNEIELSEVVSEELVNQFLAGISTKDDFDQRINCFYEKIYFNLIATKPKTSEEELLNASIKKIYQENANLKVQQLAEHTGYTIRYINRTFNQLLGFGPKSFVQFLRFQQVVDELHWGGMINNADLALKFGYYDQAHFTNEFKRFMSLTPNVYRKLLENRQFYQKVTQE